MSLYMIYIVIICGFNCVLVLCATGLFKLIADSQPYRSVEEIVESVKISSHRSGQPAFITRSDIQLTDGFIREKDIFKITDVNIRPDGGHVNCELLHREPKLCFSLSFCQQGHFTECEDDQFYTLKEIADWKISKGRRRSVSQVKHLPKKDFLFSSLLENVCGELILTPVYELKAVTRRKCNHCFTHAPFSVCLFLFCFFLLL